jgi:membrane-associated two-gene conflict system component 1 (EACC1)
MVTGKWHFDIVTEPSDQTGLDGRVRLQLRVDDGPDETESLRAWLQEDLDVQRRGDLRYGTATDPAHQGVDIQVLSLAVSSGLTTAGLVLQVLNWRRTRPSQPVVTITRELPDGTVVRIDTFDPDAVAAAVRRLENG